MRGFKCAICDMPVDESKCVRRVDMDGMTVFLCKACASKPQLLEEALKGKDRNYTAQ